MHFRKEEEENKMKSEMSESQQVLRRRTASPCVICFREMRSLAAASQSTGRAIYSSAVINE
jgi:hypothetical protein